MLWAITRNRKPNTAEAKEEYVQAHRDYLKSQKRILVLSGGALTDDGKEQIGSVIIINVNSRAEAEAYVAADPLMKAGVFTDVKITRMRKGQWNPEAAEGA